WPTLPYPAGPHPTSPDLTTPSHAVPRHASPSLAVPDLAKPHHALSVVSYYEKAAAPPCGRGRLCAGRRYPLLRTNHAVDEHAEIGRHDLAGERHFTFDSVALKPFHAESLDAV